jgi:hypothetical protein|tara:strand:- start:468 stop:707 length:240 start_codon:yes stop_codon:yes gene_type:complete
MSETEKFETLVGKIIEEAEKDDVGFVMHLSYSDDESSEIKHFNLSHKFRYDDLNLSQENYSGFLKYAKSKRDDENNPEE